jgi:hypothetical protein
MPFLNYSPATTKRTPPPAPSTRCPIPTAAAVDVEQPLALVDLTQIRMPQVEDPVAKLAGRYLDKNACPVWFVHTFSRQEARIASIPCGYARFTGAHFTGC